MEHSNHDMTSSSSPHRIGLYVPQPCSLLTLGALTESLACINQILDEEKYTLFYIAEQTDKPVTMAAGLTLHAEQAISDALDCQLLIVLASNAPQAALSDDVKRALAVYAAQGDSHLLALDNGGLWLLESGIGLDATWAWHGHTLDAAAQRYPQLALSHELYVLGERLSSGCGQAAALDCLLAYLSRFESEETIQTLADALCLERVRPGSDKQRVTSGAEMQPRLQQALALMESNLEEPLSSDELAELVHISRRQLERLFKRYLDTMPARYYLQLRLKKARHLLQTTNQSVVQIGLMCGFSSGPHFSSAYKAHYDMTPRDERAKRFKTF
ncbi:helix-turn-helix domain-containing protein [Vibrio fluvialis]